MHATTHIATCNRTPVQRGVMRCVLLLCFLSASGCNLLIDTHQVWFLAKRTTKLEPNHFPYIKNERLTRRRDIMLAKRVWAEVSATGDLHNCSKHYARGFVSGFADYMYRGGDGEAPLVPPRDYWNLSYQSDNGKQATQDWYDGFRHGVEECQARGYREMVVVRSSLLEGYTEPSGRTLPPAESLRLEPTPAETLPPPIPDAARMSAAIDLPETWGPSRPDTNSRPAHASARISPPESRAVRTRLRRSTGAVRTTEKPLVD